MRALVCKGAMLAGLFSAIFLFSACGDNTQLIGGHCFSADGQALSSLCKGTTEATANPDVTALQAQMILANVMTGLMNGGQMSEACLANPSVPPSGWSCDATYGTAQGTAVGSSSGSVFVSGTNQYQSDTMKDQFTFSASFSAYKGSSDYVFNGGLSDVVYTQPHSADGSASSFSIKFSGTLSVAGLDSSNLSSAKYITFTNIEITYANATYTITGSVGGQTDLTP